MKKIFLKTLFIVSLFSLASYQSQNCPSTIFLSQGSFSQLYEVDTSTNPFMYPTIGASAGITYNGLGLNPVDGYLYAMSLSNLIKINPATGAYTNLGAVSGAPSNVNAGDIDNLGNYYVKGNKTTIYKINLVTLSATAITLSSNVQSADLAFNPVDGFIYSVLTNSNDLVKINTTNGTVTTISTVSPNLGLTFGALFGTANGKIFGSSNNGGFYQFNTATGVPTFISASPGSDNNDGAHCVGQNIVFGVDLYTAKTDGATTFLPGTTTTYTVVVGNNGPFGAQGADVADAVPSGIPSANVSYTAAAAGGATTAVSGTQTGAIADTVDLPVGGTVTYTVTVTIPVSFTGSLTNTVTVTAPAATTTDTDLTNNTATDTDTTNVCYKPSATTGTTLDTKHGITALGRAGADNGNWPMVRKGAWTALEAKTKGFVINRLTAGQIAAIPAGNLVEGMAVYDTTNSCLKIYTTTDGGTTFGWQCINTQTCPD